MTDEEAAKRAIEAWHAFRRVELYRGDPEREAAMKDELVNYIPALAGAVERLLDERAATLPLLRVLSSWNRPDAAYTLDVWNNAADQARALLDGEKQP